MSSPPSGATSASIQPAASLTTVLLIRHGQAHCNETGTIAGTDSCRGLTSYGHEQVRLLAQRLLHYPDRIAAVYSTPVARALETATPVANALRMPVRTDPLLRGPIFGSAEGRTWAEVVAEFGAVPADHPHHPIAPGAESWTSFLDATSTMLTTLIARHQGETIAIVGHWETGIASLNHFYRLEAGSQTLATAALENTGLIIWREGRLPWSPPEDDRRRWELKAFNDACHLVSQECVSHPCSTAQLRP
ncbi:histidine phosphatase family protein [Nocardia sp. NBC_00565]|uniref:histidine phosphatase family protein n=1 Tax=Nocardia sp. NBC_00565 TaxID=2975993 RepID=UPI002E80C8BB|nr:histidine phosphatase family protein [Nocardia sp. NBC_00565]WUC02032.1 histidine phosphatase family protein [Nocardia sp. NBC_00565]